MFFVRVCSQERHIIKHREINVEIAISGVRFVSSFFRRAFNRYFRIFSRDLTQNYWSKRKSSDPVIEKWTKQFHQNRFIYSIRVQQRNIMENNKNYVAKWIISRVFTKLLDSIFLTRDPSKLLHSPDDSYGSIFTIVSVVYHSACVFTHTSRAEAHRKESRACVPRSYNASTRSVAARCRRLYLRALRAYECSRASRAALRGNNEIHKLQSAQIVYT